LNRFRIAAKTLITFRRLGLNAKAIAEGEESVGHNHQTPSKKTGHIPAAAALIGRTYGVKPGTNQSGPINSRQIMLDQNPEQMIIKSAYASNHELIKRIE
jgi:hypothetical protein